MVGVVLAVCVFAAAAQRVAARRAAARSASGRARGIDSLNPYVAFNQDAYSHVRVHLPRSSSSTTGEPQLRARLRDVVEGVERRQDVDVQDAQPNAKWSDGQPLTAADAAWTINTDVKYKDGATANSAGLIAHITRATRRTRRRSSSTTQRRSGNVLGQFQQFPILPKHIWSQHTRPQGQRPEDVPEQRADRRRRAVQPDQVPEGPDRALPAQRQVLRGPKPKVDEFGLQSSRTTTRSSRR